MLNKLFFWLQCNESPEPEPTWPEVYLRSGQLALAWNVPEIDVIRLCCNDHFFGAYYDWNSNSWMIPYPIRTNYQEVIQ